LLSILSLEENIITKCPSCGAQVNEEDSYCSCCGKPLDEKIDEMQKLGTPETSIWSMVKEAFKSLVRPSPVLTAPNRSIYLERPHSPLFPYLFGAILFMFTGLGVAYGGQWMTYIGFTLAGYAAPLYLLIWMFRNDRFEKEPIALIAYSFGWGALCGITAGVLNQVVARPLLGLPGAGLIEEPLKAYGVYLIASNKRINSEFNDHLDGMVYGAAAGAGFAGLENFWYIRQMVVSYQYPAIFAIFVRSITGFMHIAWTANAGRSLGLAKVNKGYVKLVDLLPGVIVSGIIHFLWNASSPVIAFAVLFPLMSNAIRVQVRTALADEDRWGYACFAPNESNGV
jgi:RsiW-degrading membrane proteinase PrsW (M82 family)